MLKTPHIWIPTELVSCTTATEIVTIGNAKMSIIGKSIRLRSAIVFPQKFSHM